VGQRLPLYDLFKLGTVFRNQVSELWFRRFFHSPRAFFVSFFARAKKEKSTDVVYVEHIFINVLSTFFLKKKVAKKTLAVIKMPKPSFADGLRKTILNLDDTSNLNVDESRFSHELFCELRFHRHFYQGREYQSINP
jgi:hypothetical protein